ncbi:hypothetical protein [Lewinella sp. IMCC34183]|uniref:hypothetical protein n=1 Tax=Lewinella sp. IMCC34183 TaxID=2248762 RepID=UPI000E2609FF|nr:hypothetical protein [Lewinella sp. IMCC34183]
MDLDTAKQHWQDTPADPTPQWTRQNLKRSWSHPTLTDLRRQLVLEVCCWTAFLFLFYTGLDGDQRPLFWSFALAGVLILLIAHAALGYQLSARPIGDRPVVVALRDQLVRLTAYSRYSMGLRAASLLVLFGFLMSSVPDLFASVRLWAIGTLIAWTALAIYIQYRIWEHRLGKLRTTLAELTA